MGIRLVPGVFGRGWPSLRRDGVAGRGWSSPAGWAVVLTMVIVGGATVRHDDDRLGIVRVVVGWGYSKRARASLTRRTSSRSMSFFLRRAASRRAAAARRSISRRAPWDSSWRAAR